ncbi:MAG TPA: hypothetical protein VIV54_15995 [Burkholderiales bacterium]
MLVPELLEEPLPDGVPEGVPDGVPDAPEEELPEPVLEPDEPIDEEPVAALPLRLSCLALDPAPALSRLHAVMPTARTAAVNAAVRVFNVMRLSPLNVDGELRPAPQQRRCLKKGSEQFSCNT